MFLFQLLYCYVFTRRGEGSPYSSESESSRARGSGLASGDSVPIRRSGEDSGETANASRDARSLPTFGLPGFSLMSESVADLSRPVKQIFRKRQFRDQR